MRICGRNTSTPPTPAMTPSTSRLRSGPSAMGAATCSPSQPIPASMASMGRAAQANTAWNMNSSTPTSSTMPHRGCSTQRSTRSVKAQRLASVCTASARMVRTRALSASGPGMPASRAGWAGGRPDDSRASSWASSAWAPSLRTLMAVTTGMPSAAESRAVSMLRPWAWATSNMLSTSTMGTPRAWASSTRRRLSCRWVASATQTSRSGRASPAWRPVTTSWVMVSSWLSGTRL